MACAATSKALRGLEQETKKQIRICICQRPPLIHPIYSSPGDSTALNSRKRPSLRRPSPFLFPFPSAGPCPCHLFPRLVSETFRIQNADIAIGAESRNLIALAESSPIKIILNYGPSCDFLFWLLLLFWLFLLVALLFFLFFLFVFFLLLFGFVLFNDKQEGLGCGAALNSVLCLPIQTWMPFLGNRKTESYLLNL